MFGKFEKTLKLMHSKKEFLIIVFANLLAQLGITYYVMEKTDPMLINKIGFWILFLFQIVILILLITLQVHPVIKFLLFCIFSASLGVSSASYKNKYSEPLIRAAIQSALSVFGVMFAFGLVLIGFGVNLGPRVGLLLLLSLFSLIIARFWFMLVSSYTTVNKSLSMIGIVLFSAYVVYDTNKILQRNYFGDFITASLDYYLDILNLYSNFLQDS